MTMAMIVNEGLQLARENQEIAWLATANQAADLIIEANALEAKERGRTAAALASTTGVNPEMREGLKAVRESGDAAYNKALALAKRLEHDENLFPLDHHLKEVAEARAALEAARASVDRTLDSQKPEIEDQAWVKTMTTMIETLSDLRVGLFSVRDPLHRAFQDNLGSRTSSSWPRSTRVGSGR